MQGKIYRFLGEDHVRLESLLNRAAASPYEIEPSAYAEFRAGYNLDDILLQNPNPQRP